MRGFKCMMSSSVPITASTELAEFFYILCRKKLLHLVFAPSFYFPDGCFVFFDLDRFAVLLVSGWSGKSETGEQYIYVCVHVHDHRPIILWNLSFVKLHRVWKRRGHVIFDYNSRTSWSIFIIFIPLEIGMNTPLSPVIYLLKILTTS